MKDNIKLPTKKIANLIDNLIDRRDSNWKDKLLSKEGPKPIHELHNEYYKELEESERRLENEEPYDRYSTSRGPRSGQQVLYYEKKSVNPVFQGF